MMAGPSGQTARYKWPFPTQDDNVDVPRDVGALANAVEPTVYGLVPPGVIMMWPVAAPPTGWFICNGTTVTAAANPGLDALFGHDAGGNVKLPDYQGLFALGASGGHALGEKGGSEAVALSNINQVPQHSHAVTDNGHAHGGVVTSVGNHSHGGWSGAADRSLAHQHSHGRWAQNVQHPQGGGGLNVMYAGEATYYTGGEASPDHLHAIGADGAHNHGIPNGGTGISIQNAGSAAPATHPNMPPYVAINYIIKGG